MAADPPTKLLLLSLLLVSSLRFSWCQRLSTGASDWYMRFHDFDDLVKRSVDRPVTRSFRVSSSVRHRFASTAVRTAVHNPAPVEQTFRFGFAMPAAALVSGVRLARDSDYEGASSRFNESGWKEGRYYHAGQRGRYFGGEEEMEEDEGGAEGQVRKSPLLYFGRFFIPVFFRSDLHHFLLLSNFLPGLAERRRPADPRRQRQL